MSYDLCCLVMGVEEDIRLPNLKQIKVENEYSPDSNSGRYYDEYPFMTMQRGTWFNLLNPEKSYLGAYGLCDADFELAEAQPDFIKVPYWVQDEDSLYGLVPLIVFDEYVDEFKRITEYLLDRSPIGKLMFLARFQSRNDDIVCGVIPITDFFNFLANREILYNVCYIISKEVYSGLT